MAVLGSVAFLSTQASAQQSATAKGNAAGYPQDWSHHHVVFSDPGSYGDAMATGTLKQWNAITRDPRYSMQQAIRNAVAHTVAQDDQPTSAASLVVRSLIKNRKKSKINTDWSASLGSSTSSVGAGQYPAKYSFSTTSASCSDFVVYNTSRSGTSGRPSIIAFTNIYGTSGPNGTGCGAGSSGGAVPKIYWEYNTGGTITTSVVLSADGSQVAFIHNPGTSNAASLVLLKWAATGTTLTISAASNAGYRTCVAPCMTTFTFSDPGGATGSDTFSAPFYDYANDVIYVGDDYGYLHKFTGVFKGTPAEATSPWPVFVNTGQGNLGSPVYDGNGNVFVADFLGSSTGTGYLYRVTSAGTRTQSTLLAADGLPFADAPIVDPTAGKVYLFESEDLAASNAGVFQLPTNFTGSTPATEAKIGTASTTEALYAGALDNIYFSSSNSSSPSGNLYVCGNPGGSPTLYQIGITTNSMSTTANSKATPGNSSATCSPVTEFYNNGTDYAFLSVTAANSSPPSGCTSGSGCVASYNITSTSVSLSGASTEAGGTSGIVIDNNVTSGILAGASEVYFSTLTGGNAIQASQAAP